MPECTRTYIPLHACAFMTRCGLMAAVGWRSLQQLYAEGWGSFSARGCLKTFHSCHSVEIKLNESWKWVCMENWRLIYFDTTKNVLWVSWLHMYLFVNGFFQDFPSQLEGSKPSHMCKVFFQSVHSQQHHFTWSVTNNIDTLSDSATPYSKCATPYTVGLWRK